MPKGQGLSRLTSGVTRDLTKSEVDRGYLFVTKDSVVLDRFNSKLEVKINNSSLGLKPIDKQGRVFPGSRVMSAAVKHQKVYLLLDSSTGVLRVKLI